MRKIRVATSSRSNFGTTIWRAVRSKIPDIAIDEGDHHRRAQEDEGGPEMITPAEIKPVDPGRGVAAEGEGEELEENPEGDAGAPFEYPPERKRDEEGQDEDRNRFDCSWSIDQGKHIRGGRVAERDGGRQARRSARRPDEKKKPAGQETKPAERGDRTEPFYIR